MTIQHNYTVRGMTCNACVMRVKKALENTPGISSAEVSLEQSEAVLSMDEHIDIEELQKNLGDHYTIQEQGSKSQSTDVSIPEDEANTSMLQTYKPLILIFLFITGVSTITSIADGTLNAMMWMNNFMAGFFIVFAFFKLLDLRGFAESYAMYDLLAKRVKSYGYIYPFLELGLGIAYLTSFYPAFTYIATIIIMGFSSIGVIQSVLDKTKIRCACLGSVFNLPMTTVTIIEDLLMVAMAAVMLAML